MSVIRLHAVIHYMNYIGVYTVNIGFNDIGFNDKSLITTQFACPESRSIINITSDLATNRI